MCRHERGRQRIEPEDAPAGATATDDGRYLIYKGHFDDHVAPDPERERRDHWVRKGLIEAVWGWAITCHKAQGSQFPTAVVFDGGLGRTAQDRSQWLYTAITRAEWGLVIVE